MEGYTVYVTDWFCEWRTTRVGSFKMTEVILLIYLFSFCVLQSHHLVTVNPMWVTCHCSLFVIVLSFSHSCQHK